jgi:hypothetical protein
VHCCSITAATQLQTAAVRNMSNTARRMRDARGTGARALRKDIDGDREVPQQQARYSLNVVRWSACVSAKLRLNPSRSCWERIWSPCRPPNSKQTPCPTNVAIGSISVLFLSRGPLTRGFFSENLKNSGTSLLNRFLLF